MDRQKKQRLEHLVKRLGMTYEMSPLLDSDEAYKRFENAIDTLLEGYKGKKRTVWGKVKGVQRYSTVDDEKICAFRNVYGIGCEPRNYFEIGEEVKGKFIDSEERKRLTEEELMMKKTEIAKRLSKEKYRHTGKLSATKNSFRGIIFSRAEHIIQLLKMRHKKDIWYKTL